MVIEIPNSVDTSKLRLTEVLFSLEVGYTLVSIGQLDELGYTVIFTDSRCIINDPMENVIGQIPRTERGLYRVIHKANLDSADSIEETITVMELHKHMGHIAPTVARCLTENGLVSGIKVNLSSGEPTFCETCVYVKATCKPIAKA
jgi:hypothetical protein